MSSSNFDVVVVGAGAAGLTAAIGLARAGFAVAVVEAASFPGAENWSGCVYFCENLVHPDILGPEGVEALAWERRLVERGAFATDGHSLLGMTYRDSGAFRHCYTVLRPIFDHHVAQMAVKLGVALLAETTAESLIREGSKVIGVCTQRGAIYADLVFLAEGDASHLVTREGYERYTDAREAPKFLQGIKQVIELPPGVIEDTFEVGPEEGVAYEMLLRNGSLRGRSVRLNMGGFVYANRQSLSVGLVLPADNLKDHFGGDPNLLMEWFSQLPVLQPWLKHGRKGTFGAKIIRGGGAKDIPRLIDDGLAIGGAASAIGIDFPYPNFTGPATGMGLLLVQAAKKIRAERGAFTQDALRQHYLEPLQKTHYWKDVEFLRRWPAYVKRTQVFFGRNIDLSLGTAYVWSRPGQWFLSKWFNWLRVAWHIAGPTHWNELRSDQRHLVRALQLGEVIGRPGLGRLLLDGAVNALRDLFGSPRPDLPAAGTVQLHYSVDGGAELMGQPPRLFRRWFQRFTPVLASAARRVYINDSEPLAYKMHGAISLMLRQLNMLDLMGAGMLSIAAGVSTAFLLGWDRLRGLFRKRRSDPTALGGYPRYTEAARKATDLTPIVATAAQQWEGRLGQLAYQTVKASHIHVLWPKTLADKNAVVNQGLWHVCPAHVYEARVNPQGQLQVVVNFENCIKCETCWRTSDLVDWARDGQHRFIYPIRTPVVTRLLAAMQTTALSRPTAPQRVDAWETVVRDLEKRLRADRPGNGNVQSAAEVAELQTLLERLRLKLEAFDEALAEEPRTVDRARADYLEMLARYAQQIAVRIAEVLRGSALANHSHPSLQKAHEKLAELAGALVLRAEQRARRTWDQHYAWAAADGRQLRAHHMIGLDRYLRVIGKSLPAHAVAPDPVKVWLQSENDAVTNADVLQRWSAKLDAVFPGGAWRDLERQTPLTKEQDAGLRDLLAQVPALDPNNLAGTLHPPIRKALLAELARRDPSLAYRAACHLWARDLARLSGAAALGKACQRWTRGDEWACFAAADAVQTFGTGWKGEILFVPAARASSLLLLVGDQLAVIRLSPSETRPGLHVDPLLTLGLRGAGMARIRLDNFVLGDERAAVDRDRIRRAWSVLSSADLTSIAFGMADQLCRRTIAHATSRVQFPGLFHDEQSRDTIGKFGAVKKMVAEMGARRLLIETLDHVLSPTDFSSPSVAQAGLIKKVVSEALGTAPGSLSYNAGQVFGGTGYSEDDILSKFYRDASAWRFLGPTNVEIGRRHGDELLRGWRPDGQKLAALRNEAELFDQLAQRKALQAELDEVRVVRSRLRGMVNEWLAAVDVSAGSRATPVTVRGADGRFSLGARALAEVSEGLARQDAHLLASKALLLRLHARLEEGLPSEIETALVRVWLEDASVAMEEFESNLRHHFAQAGAAGEQPVVEPSAGLPTTNYRDFLASPAPYDSGDFLEQPVDLLQPRLVPEMIESDPVLKARDEEFRTLLAGYFGQPRPDGLSYERHIERQHRPDEQDLDFCRRHGFFRMPIPPDLGGEGRQKVDYYLLTTNAQRLADVGISLAIQANTSIGTTPVLLAHDKDLPKAQKDLGPFVGDTSLQSEIRTKLEELVGPLSDADPRRIEQAYRELNKRLEETVFAKPVLRVLAHRFAEAWGQAGRAGKEFDLPTFRQRLAESLNHWKDACGRAEEMHGEMPRRRQACDQFLRWVSSGQISAFALTEPSAGSDTARVATRAVLRSVAVEREANGTLRFVPFGSKEPRILLDAARMEFRKDEGGVYRAYYRSTEGAEPSRIHFDEYDYETDAADCKRYYERGGQRVHFTDIAQVRERGGRSWYDYWELTGAKMWITNGRMCGIMCLYAKTEEGITGFIVDRHAEGLIVGKDEEKLGQCGSPTNELSLQTVRVPRENVIGLEGRGQVNALETLNVGRAGLAMSAMAQMQGLIEQSRSFAQTAYGDVPDWVAWRLQRMEEERFTSEALAFEVIGRFEHPQTKSGRMESAISKTLVSESLHRVIELAEEVHGLAGQTQLHLVEKRKRDARVLNIYEGTNEIQRFFILKDVAGAAADKRKVRKDEKTRHTSREALDLETLRGGVRQRIDVAVGQFGQQLWQNPNLQANCFLLAEATAWLKAADSTLGRLAWLNRHELAAGEEDTPAEAMRGSHWSLVAEVGHRALTRCLSEVRDRLRRFDEELAHLRRGYYAPQIRAASLLFDRATKPQMPARPTSAIAKPLSILVVLEPSATTLPHPYLQDGKLLEPYWTLTDTDRAALETALRLRDEASASIAIQAIAVGPRGAATVLREALNLGVDRARFVVCEAESFTPDSAAAALATTLKPGLKFDLILGGAGSVAGEEGLLAELTAEALGVPHAGSAMHLAIRSADGAAEVLLVGADERQRFRSLPLAVGVEAGMPLRAFTVQGYLTASSKAIEIERWPRRVEVRPVTLLEGMHADGAAEVVVGTLTPIDAAGRVLDELGLHVGPQSAVQPFDGTIEETASPTASDNGVLAILAADAEGRLQPPANSTLRAARLLGDLEGQEMSVLLLVPTDEQAQREAVAHVRALCRNDVVLLPVAAPGNSVEVHSRFLAECWPTVGAQPRAVVGEPWTELAFAMLAGRSTPPDLVSARVRQFAFEGEHILLESARARGKLIARQVMPGDGDGTRWIVVAADAEVLDNRSAVMGRLKPFTREVLDEGRVLRWSARADRFYTRQDIQRLLKDIQAATGLVQLTDAEFIIDVGFGVGNRDGYEAVIEPLEKALSDLGVRGMVIGGSRKVTEELHLLPADRQIGQSGVSVAPRLLLAIGISGAPQHINYIGARSVILAFNRDPEAPIMTLNRRQPRPRVFPVVGDLFDTVPALIEALKSQRGVEEAPQHAGTARS
ncbi:MAG: FAD-binding protein [Gemmataceae bacterium]|nr:FAD-binding protein [Gemmataceae bacterium]